MVKGQAHFGAARNVARTPVQGAFRAAGAFVEHPLLRPQAVAARAYQLELAARALAASTLVVLPAGLGKTVVAALVAAERLRTAGGFVLLVAPTRPVARQHEEAFKAILADSVGQRIHLVTGSTSRGERDRAWREAWLVVSTPETVAKELESGALTLTRCSLLIVVEAHRAIGGYAYVEVARALRRDRPGGLTLGLTASPAADRRRVAAVVDALGIRQVEMRDRDDPEVALLVRPVDVEVYGVDLTAGMQEVQAVLETELGPLASRLVRAGALPRGPVRLLTRGELVAAGEILRRPRGRRGADTSAVWQVHAQALLLVQALELLETLGCAPLCAFLDRMGQGPESPRAERALASTKAVREALRLARALESDPHPKVEGLVGLLRDLLRERPGAKAIVVAPHRETVQALAELLSRAPPIGLGVPCAAVGGMGLSGNLGALGPDHPSVVGGAVVAGPIQVQVATSVGQDGVDFARVELVVFFEAVPSEMRALHRGGRTARARPHRVAVLVARDTRDEGALRASERGERGMAEAVHLVARKSRSRWSAAGPNRVLPVDDAPSRERQGAEGLP